MTLPSGSRSKSGSSAGKRSRLWASIQKIREIAEQGHRAGLVAERAGGARDRIAVEPVDPQLPAAARCKPVDNRLRAFVNEPFVHAVHKIELEVAGRIENKPVGGLDC